MARGPVIKPVSVVTVNTVKVPHVGTVTNKVEILPPDAGFRFVTEINGKRNSSHTVSADALGAIVNALENVTVFSEIRGALRDADDTEAE